MIDLYTAKVDRNIINKRNGLCKLILTNIKSLYQPIATGNATYNYKFGYDMLCRL